MRIPEADARHRLQSLPGWDLHGDAISRTLVFAGFPQAVAFVVRLGFLAEAADHHPDIVINYRRVTLTYTTHSEGGLTEKDFVGASEASKLVSEMAAQ